MKKVFIGLVVLLCSVFGITAYANEEEGAVTEEERIISFDENIVNYAYKYSFKDPEWETFDSTLDKVNACRLGHDAVEAMSSLELVQAVLDYPLNMELFAYDTIEMGLDSLANICDAYKELLTRPDCYEVIKWRYDYTVKKAELTNDEKDIIDSLVLERLLLGEFISGGYRNNNLFSVNQSTVVQTPRGSNVTVEIRYCTHPSSYHAQISQQMAAQYNVTYEAAGTCAYNCHSYAWYSQSTSNNYWMNNPILYMTDGSYRQVMSHDGPAIYVASGDIVFYGVTTYLLSTHSAILVSGASNSNLSTRLCRSKWGEFGIYKHAVNRVPASYAVSQLTVWRRD